MTHTHRSRTDNKEFSEKFSSTVIFGERENERVLEAIHQSIVENIGKVPFETEKIYFEGSEICCNSRREVKFLLLFRIRA